jgi:hypothetical protein
MRHRPQASAGVQKPPLLRHKRDHIEESLSEGTPVRVAKGTSVAGRVEQLFGAVRYPKTGEPYTSGEVARMSAGDYTEKEVEEIRTGAIPDPTVGQVAALAAVFGVEPSYLMDREGSSPLDAELLEGLRDETTREITREAMRLPERERRIVLGIVRQFEAQRGALAREEPSGK